MFSFCRISFSILLVIGVFTLGISQTMVNKSNLLKAEKGLPDLPKPQHQVLIVGTFHFDSKSNASDWKSGQVANMKSEAKQKEIEEVVLALKQFKPTKICIEWMENTDSIFNARYQKYLAGTWELGVHETYQIGFRLAKMMRHAKVYCIDNKPEQPKSVIEIEDWDKYALEMGGAAEMKKIDPINLKHNLYVDSISNSFKLKDALLFLNGETYRRASKRIWFTGLVHMGNKGNYAGADLTGHWYQRNIRIFSNIKKIATEPEERILIIYGAGHGFVLDEIFKASQEYEVVELKSLLK
jgi:hypothetical protein